MTDDRADGPTDDPDIPTDRESPVGAPVIRGDESVTGDHARRAVQFDPDDPESLARAATTVAQFANGSPSDDHLYMLRGAAACAALVRGEGSYKAAAERASHALDTGDELAERPRRPQGPDGEANAQTGGSSADTVDVDDEHNVTTDVSVSFIRKWARVHDLPRSVRRQVAMGTIAPSAAKHIARVGGDSRLLLAWAILDGDLTVREVRRVASQVNDGVAIGGALEDCGVTLGTLEVTLPAPIYRELRREAALENVDPGTIVAEALEVSFDSAAGGHRGDANESTRRQR